MRSDTTATSGPIRRPLRTVTPPYRGRRDDEMSTVGWGIALVLLVLLLPLGLPLLVVWLAYRLLR